MGIAERIREKVFNLTEEEVPHSITCISESVEVWKTSYNIRIAIIVDREDIIQELNIKNIDTSIVKVKDTIKALSILASNYYDSPKDKIKLIGITGTS